MHICRNAEGVHGERLGTPVLVSHYDLGATREKPELTPYYYSKRGPCSVQKRADQNCDITLDVFSSQVF